MISCKKFQGYNGGLYATGFEVVQNMNLFSKIILENVWSPIIWKNGARKTENFIVSHFMVLDFDQPGEETMAQIDRSFCDTKRIIATTRSHQVEKNGVTCDRFRLVVPFSRPITNYEEYRFNYKRALVRFDWADKSCLDGARYFFPSKKIVVCDRDAEFYWDVQDFTEELKQQQVVHQTTYVHRTIPSFVLGFINNGYVYDSRNLTCFRCALDLFKSGFDENEIRELLLRSPIKWAGVNLDSIIKSAKGKWKNV